MDIRNPRNLQFVAGVLRRNRTCVERSSRPRELSKKNRIYDEEETGPHEPILNRRNATADVPTSHLWDCDISPVELAHVLAMAGLATAWLHRTYFTLCFHQCRYISFS
ncbi:hypothetical protein EVAR_67640_1 [Eumeta japonica]|uniref:Uncharacterized protein n=1 Tax=Eumeta variegata TaxID=151549 RepID=A0A4C1Z5E0_EUMVA|nr:hypothetical protein EVAR_67640_1 [Eumeta japonica]